MERVFDVMTLASMKLKHKVFAGFFSVGLIAMSIAWVGYDSFYHVATNLKTFIEQENKAELHLTLARNVSEIQRQALMYTYAGYAGAAERVRFLYQEINDSLQKNGMHKLNHIDLIQQHLNNYMQAFSKLQQQRDLQFDLIHHQLKDTSRRAQAFVSAHIRKTPLNHNNSDHLTEDHLLNDLLRVENDATHYFDSLEPQYISQVKGHFSRIRKQLNYLQSHPEYVINPKGFQQGLIIIDTYERVFLEAVQRTRAYLFLVNVVMSAEAYEVLYQTNKMSDLSSREMGIIEQETLSMLEQASSIMVYGMLLAFAAMLLVSLFLSRSITQPIVQLTGVFNALAKGSHQATIPTYAAKDEIGHLTQAAFAFKEKNHQTEKLLDQAEELNIELNKYKADLETLVDEKTQEIRIFSSAVSHVNEAIMITDSDGLIEYANPAFAQLTGYANADVVGQKTRFLDESQAGGLHKAVWKSIKSGDVWQGRVMNKHKDGSLYPSLLSISSIKSDDGLIEHFVSVQKDITDYEKLEGQLHHAKKMEALGTLVGGIAHEFNNSLAGVTGNLFLAKEEAAHLPSILSKLDTIEKLSFASAELIKSLLSFAHKGTVRKVVIPVSTFLLESIEVQRISLPEDIVLNSDVDVDDLLIEGDTNLLKQVMVNIIKNAADALGGIANPLISVKADLFHAKQRFFDNHPECSAKKYARISIADNGMGIKADDLAQVFDPFFTTKEVGEGTGLGLSMAYGVMQTHAGAIEIDSQLKRGTTVTLYLPLSKGSETDQVKIKETIVHGQHELILFVDDNPSILKIGKKVLESLNYEVLTARSGAIAIDLYKTNMDKIKLVLVDVVMPSMSGVEAVAKLREINPDIKVIFATGYDRNSLRQSKDIEEEIIISKPFTISLLSHSIKDKL